MTPEQTKEFIELCDHPAIKEKFDGWRIGDKAIIIATGEAVNILYISEISRTGRVLISSNLVFKGWMECKHLVWLPPVFSYTNPNRSLWAWVDWELFGLATHEDGLITIYSPKSNFLYTGPFSIALAKAVIWKWEQKEKK